MQEKPCKIKICDKEIPLWCDIFVINELQEKYGTVGEFERKLIGLQETEDGKFIKREKDLGAITFALRLMIKEGYRKLEAMGEQTEKADVEQLLMDVDIPFTDLADIIHDAFRRCFTSKK